MVLINIDTLSDAELRYIAQQEDLEGWETSSREQIIEDLESLYDDSEDIHANMSGSSSRKFVQTLTDVDSDNVFKLPGVDVLPEQYNETCIHLLMRDFNWAYAFWSINAQQQAELENQGAQLLLRTSRLDDQGNECAFYDIDINLNDTNWTIELPHLGYKYKTCLMAQCSDKQVVICQSNTICTSKSFLKSHPEKLQEDRTFKVLIQNLITKEGEVLGNRQVEDLVSELSSEVR